MELHATLPHAHLECLASLVDKTGEFEHLSVVALLHLHRLYSTGSTLEPPCQTMFVSSRKNSTTRNLQNKRVERAKNIHKPAWCHQPRDAVWELSFQAERTHVNLPWTAHPSAILIRTHDSQKKPGLSVYCTLGEFQLDVLDHT